MLEALTGTGLAASAGLNAYIPLLVLGILGRYSDLVDLPAHWQWLSNGWVITVLAALLAIEVVADKVPVVDHINDVVQTVVRPTSGGLVFGAGAGTQSVTASDPGRLFASDEWIPVVIGMLIALGVHVLKALIRPLVNTATAGIATPLISATEDAASVIMSMVALLLPVLVLLFLAGSILATGWLVRRRRISNRERRAERAAGFH
ncbi:MAG TPA: DUF4126 domain-containing protein [Micromonosporaceae bacterium]